MIIVAGIMIAMTLFKKNTMISRAINKKEHHRTYIFMLKLCNNQSRYR